jgi:catechol-2,3-dioxygenase
VDHRIATEELLQAGKNLWWAFQNDATSVGHVNIKTQKVLWHEMATGWHSIIRTAMRPS